MTALSNFYDIFDKPPLNAKAQFTTANEHGLTAGCLHKTAK